MDIISEITANLPSVAAIVAIIIAVVIGRNTIKQGKLSLEESRRNLEAITEVALYLYARTGNPIPYDKEHRFIFEEFRRMKLAAVPYGIKELGSNDPNLRALRYFDFILGNAGPGIALIDGWRINYDENNEDFKDMHDEKHPSVLGPGAERNIAGYIPRDWIKPSLQGVRSDYGKVPTKSGDFPWILRVTYSRYQRKGGKQKFVAEFRVDCDGRVAAPEPEVVG